MFLPIVWGVYGADANGFEFVRQLETNNTRTSGGMRRFWNQPVYTRVDTLGGCFCFLCF